MSIETEVYFCPYSTPCDSCKERFTCFTTVKKGQEWLLTKSKAKIAYNEDFALASFLNLEKNITYYDNSIEFVKLLRMQSIRIGAKRYYIQDIRTRQDGKERRTIYKYKRINPLVKVCSVSSLDRISACHAEETSSILVQSANILPEVVIEYREIWLKQEDV